MDTVSGRSIRSKASRYLGVILLAVGILCNRWILENTIVPDGSIASPPYVLSIYILQIMTLLAGLYLTIRRPLIKIPSKKNLLLAFTVTICFFLILEISVNIWLDHIATPAQKKKYALSHDLPPEGSQWSRHHYLNYYPTPYYRSGLTHHNSLGFRNNELSIQKPEGVYRIVVLGGSDAYSLMVEDNKKTFTAQLESALRDRYKYKDIEVINAGVSGYNSWESLINLQFRVLDIEPDMIIVSAGYDDVHSRLVSPSAYIGDNKGRRKQWEQPTTAFYEKSSLLRLFSRYFGFTRQGSLPLFVSSSTYMGACSAYDTPDTSEELLRDLLRQNPPVYLRRNLLNMAAIAGMHNIRIMLATFAFSTVFDDYVSTTYYREGFAENNEVIKEVANDLDIPVFDFASVMSEEERYWADGRHLNDEGSARKASLFADFIADSAFIK